MSDGFRRAPLIDSPHQRTFLLEMERVRQAFAGEEPGDVGHRTVDEARRKLRSALISKLSASPSAEELQRVAEVLKRATEELRRRKS